MMVNQNHGLLGGRIPAHVACKCDIVQTQEVEIWHPLKSQCSPTPKPLEVIVDSEHDRRDTSDEVDRT